ncbi:HIT domain-containing protein [Candidatus Uhrbacteria bacterium]|nr:HIT domain-containing protein [Candidatus Uhrbacteria bacterium]
MYNHAPENYQCPICLAIEGVENESTWIKQADIFYKDELVMGFISSKAIKGNEGHPLIVPIKHFENLYELPDDYGHRIFEVSKKVTLTMKAIRQCDGVTVLQNNEPAGDQHAFHYHLHLVPRFVGDRFSEELWKAQKSNPEDRVDYASVLRSELSV